MITLKHIHIEHFMSIEDLDLDFEGSSLYAITGQNGSGKSSLLYAIAFCLTGYRKGESYKDYVQVGYETGNITLEAMFKGSPITYEVMLVGNQKTSKTSKRRVVYNGVEYINSDYNQFIKEYELEYLESLMFMFQGSYSIIDAKPSERAATLKKIFRFEFDDIVKGLKEKFEDCKTLNLENTAVLNELKSRTYETQPLLREVVEETISQWESRLEKVTEDLKKVENVSSQDLNNYQQELISLQKTINEVSRKIQEDTITEDKALLDTKEYEAFLKNNSSVEEIEKRIESLKKTLQEKQTVKENLLTVLSSLREQKGVEDHSLKEIAEQIKISKTGVCHACGQPIDPSHVENLEKKKDILTQKIQDLNFSISEKDQELKKAAEEYRSTNQEIVEVENLKVNIKFKTESLKHSKEKLKDLKKSIKDQNDYLEVLNEKMRSLKEKESELKNLETVINEKEGLISERKDLEEKVNSAKENKLRNVERRTANENIRKEQQANDIRVSEISEKLNEISLNQSTIKSSIDIFENQFPAYLILQATQILEDYINLIVQKVFPNIKVKLSQQRAGVNFFYRIEGVDEEWLPVVMASGAQKQVLALAYQVGLAKLYGLETICLDEVDASMSSENAEVIYEFITSLDNFKQIIFISHRKESIEIAKQVNPNTICYYVEKGEYNLIED